MSNWFFTALVLGSIGCADLPAPAEAVRSVDQFYMADSAGAELARSAMGEWASFGFDFSVTTERPSAEHFSEIRIVDRVCADWPGSPENAIGCAYALRQTADGLLWDSAMTARAKGDAVAYIIEVKRGSDLRREVLHELGHVAGFCHVPGGTLMNAVANSAVALTSDDLAHTCEKDEP